VPDEKKHFWRPEALALRQAHGVLFVAHVCFLITDCWIYAFEISAIIFDLAFLWLNFYNYMTLNKIVIGIQLGLYALAVLIALTHFKRVAVDTEYWAPLWVYLTQYILTYLGGGAYLGLRFYTHFMQQHNYKADKYSKTIGGRLYKKGQKRGEDILKPIVKKRMDSILYDPSDEEDDYEAEQLKQLRKEIKENEKLEKKKNKKQKSVKKEKDEEVTGEASEDDKNEPQKQNRFLNFKANAKQKFNKKISTINDLYKQHRDEKNMRPEDKKLLKELIEDLNEEKLSKADKKTYKFGNFT
jgi:hypothetical protein